jgi:hypothetical protein
MWLWVVYYVRGITPRLTVRYYVGAVRVQDGETLQQALDRRLQQHASQSGYRALWLKICTDLKIFKLHVCDSPFDARAMELISVAGLFEEHGFKVRGGPFSTITIGEWEVAELHALAKFSSPQNLNLLEGPCEFRMSKRHMNDLCFSCGRSGHQSRECAKEVERRTILPNSLRGTLAIGTKIIRALSVSLPLRKNAGLSRGKCRFMSDHHAQ